MTKLRMTLTIIAGALLLALTFGIQAKTPDGKPPSEETVCDSLTGSLFGLCNAYCEAMDCTDPNQKASNQACDRVLTNFMRKSGGNPPPCVSACPCFDTAQIDAVIDDQNPVECTDTEFETSVEQDPEAFGVISGEAFVCFNLNAGLNLIINEQDHQDCLDQIVNSNAWAACP